MIVFLDTNILSIVTRPGNQSETSDCKRWYQTLLIRGARIVTSEICEYEERRGLVQQSFELGENVGGLQELDNLREVIEFLPVTADVWRAGAQVWAESINQSMPMTDPKRLDADSIICAHWRCLDEENLGRAVIIASTNLRDLNRFATADLWRNIRL